MFETAIFTDVTASESLDGQTGFTFQAVSPGFTVEDQAVSRNSLIHQVSPRLEAALDLADQSFRYRFEYGSAYFSRGISLGQTSSGRGGNQLTQIAVAHAPQDLGSLTPAQIFFASEWDLQKVPGGAAPQWPTPLGVSHEVEAESLIAWIKQDRQRALMARALVTAVDRKLRHSGPQTIALVHDDLSEVLRWWSIASVLSNPQAAASLSFQAFVEDVGRSDAAVVGCRVADKPVAHDQLAVFDLTGQTPLPEVAPTAGARLTLDVIDALDVDRALEIIRLARRWDPYVASEEAFWAANLVHSNLPPAEVVEGGARIAFVVGELAQAGLTADVEQYAPAFSRALAHVDTRSPDVLRVLAHAARELREKGSDSAAAIFLKTIVNDSSTGQNIGAWAPELLGGTLPPWPAAVPGSPRWIEPLLELEAYVPPSELHYLFRLADSLGPEAYAASEDWARAEEAYALECIRNPRLLGGIEGTWIAPQIRERVRDQLLKNLGRQGDAVRTLSASIPEVDDVRTGRWDALLDRRYSREGKHYAPLADAVASIQLGSLPVKERIRSLEGRREHYAPGDWAYALAGTHPRDDSALWAAWVEACGATEALAEYVQDAVDADLARQPSKALKGWRPVLERLERVDRGHGAEWRRLQGEVDAQLRTVPGLTSHAKGVFGGLTGRGSSRRDEGGRGDVR